MRENCGHCKRAYRDTAGEHPVGICPLCDRPGIYTLRALGMSLMEQEHALEKIREREET